MGIEWKRDALAAVVPVVLAAALFAGTVGGGFVYDDHIQIQGNGFIRDPGMYWRALWSDVAAFSSADAGPASPYWRPTFVVWMIVNYNLFGVESAAGWRVGNVLLHAGATLLAYALSWRVGLSRMLAAVAATIFAVHPSRSENVAWASGVSDLLCAAPLLGSLILVVGLAERGAAGTRAKRVLVLLAALVLYGVSLGAKEIAVLFPLVVFAAGIACRCDGGRLVLDKGCVKPAGLLTAPFFILAVGYAVIRSTIVGGISFPVEDAPDFITTLKTLPLVGAFYLRQAFAPLFIGPIYPIRPVEQAGLLNFVLPLLLVLAAAAGFLWAIIATRSRAALVGTALFALPLLPACNIGSFLPEQLVHDRYLYIPLLGLVIVLLVAGAHVLRLVRRGEIVLAAVALIWCVPLGIQTVRYNNAWLSDLALWTWGARFDPSSTFALTQQGIYLMTAGRMDEARVPLEGSLTIKWTPRASLTLADVDFRQDRLEEAERSLARLLDEAPDRLAPLEMFSAADLLARIWLERDDDVPRALALYREIRRRLPGLRATITDRIGMILMVDERPPKRSPNSNPRGARLFQKACPKRARFCSVLGNSTRQWESARRPPEPSRHIS